MIFESDRELEIGSIVHVSEYELEAPVAVLMQQCATWYRMLKVKPEGVPGKVMRRATLEEFIAEAAKDDPNFEAHRHLYEQHRPWAFHYEISLD